MSSSKIAAMSRAAWSTRIISMPCSIGKSKPVWHLQRRAASQVDLYLWGECCIGKIGKAAARHVG